MVRSLGGVLDGARGASFWGCEKGVFWKRSDVLLVCKRKRTSRCFQNYLDRLKMRSSCNLKLYFDFLCTSFLSILQAYLEWVLRQGQFLTSPISKIASKSKTHSKSARRIDGTFTSKAKHTPNQLEGLLGKRSFLL